MSDELDPTKFEIGVIGDRTDPDAVMIQLPLKHPNLSDDQIMDLCVGRVRRIEAYVVQAIKVRVMNRKQKSIKPGVILPDGRPATIQ